MVKKYLMIIGGVIGLFFVVCVTYHVVGGLTIGGFFNPQPTKEQIVKEFQDEIVLINTVRDYLLVLEYDEVYIPDTNEKGTMFVGLGNGDINIGDETVVGAISRLWGKGYSVIEKNNNTISFQRWSNLDNGIGLAYSITGGEPTLQFLTKLEPLNEPNWYYYEEDFNEWKRLKK